MSTYQNQVLCSLKEARDIVFEYASLVVRITLRMNAVREQPIPSFDCIIDYCLT